MGQVVIIGFATFVLYLLLSRALPDPLPTGSYRSEFDSSIWLHPNSAYVVLGGATPRQKILAGVVAKLPGGSRDELEQTLGPSLETNNFQSTGHDLVYILDSERDSFVGVDSEWLLIWLDANGVFARYEIVND